MTVISTAAPLAPASGAPARPPLPLQIVRVDHAGRRIPVSRSVHIRGYEPVGPGRPAVAFESLLERRFIRAFARIPEVRDIVAQPLTIHYRHGDQACRYTPDLLVIVESLPRELETLGFGLRTLIEVKPDRRLTIERDRLDRHFRAVRLACAEAFVLLTEADLDARRLEVLHDGV